MPSLYKFLSHFPVLHKLYLKRVVNQEKITKLVIGASTSKFSGWLSTDKKTLNIFKREDWGYFFEESSLSNVLAEHVFEHLTYDESLIAFQNIHVYLKKGGRLRVAVPDGNFPSKDYIDYVKPGGYGPGSDDHKILYDYKSLKDLLIQAGFKVDPLEYFDQSGNFHIKNWNTEDGMIFRSRFHDERNNENEINYTSLIVDAFKF